MEIFENLSLIYCADTDNLIGLDLIYTDDYGKKIQIIPWENNNIYDLNYFKQVISNYTVIMGYNTFESIGVPLPKHKNIVLTCSHQIKLNQEFPTVKVLNSFETIDEYIRKTNEKIFIIGGTSLFNRYWNQAKYIYQTEIRNYKLKVDENEIASKTYIQKIDDSIYNRIERLYISEENNGTQYIRNVWKHIEK